MTESSFSGRFEAPRIKREEVVAAYQELSREIKHPAELDINNPAVARASELLDTWMAQGDTATAGKSEMARRHEIDKIMILIDAGFTAKPYLEAALGLLSEYAKNAPEIEGDIDRAATIGMLSQSVRRIEDLLSSNPQ